MNKKSSLFYLSSLILLVANATLSYWTGLTVETKIFIFVSGILGPLFFIYQTLAKPEEIPITTPSDYKEHYPYLFIFFTLLFISIETLTWFIFKPWPVPDEGLLAYYGIELSQKWQFHLYYSSAQCPPIFIWLLSVFFKLITPSLLSDWFLTALVASFAAGSSYFAFRYFFSRSISLMIAFLFSASFWTFYVGRFSMPMGLLIFWEVLSLAALGRWIRSPNTANSILFVALLGSGLWQNLSWPLVVFFAIVVILKTTVNQKNSKNQFILLISVLLITVLFGLISLTVGNGRHILNLFALKIGVDSQTQLADSLSNISALFWGCDLQNSYGPLWGGMLNPILASVFFIGLMRLFREIKSPISQSVLLSFILFMVPGLITTHFEIFRDCMVILPLFVIIAWGIQVSIHPLTAKYKYWVLASLFFTSAVLDTIHLFKSYQITPQMRIHSAQPTTQWPNAWKSLNEMAQKSGPGLILLDLQPSMEDLTLRLACYPINAADNLQLDPEKSSWAAVIENVYYTSFVEARFPESTFYDLGPDTLWNQGDLTLAIIPITPQNKAALFFWLEVNRRFHQIGSEMMFDDTEMHHEEIFKKFEKSEPAFNSDPFVESVFYEKLIYLGRKNLSLFEIASLIEAEKKNGYLLPHLLATQGLLYFHSGHLQEALKAFQNTVRLPNDMTNARQNLNALKLILKIKNRSKI